MKTIRALAAVCIALSVLGCSGQSGRSSLQAQNHKMLEENEQRLISLEQSINALNSQVAQLNNRVYEVRNKNGQKTSMTVVPITPPAPKGPSVPEAKAVPVMKPGDTAANARHANATQNAVAPETAKTASSANVQAPSATVTQTASSTRKTEPVGRKIDPAAVPAPLRASAAPVQTPARNSASSGRVGQTNPAPAPATDELGLPPMDLPVPAIAAPAQQNAAPATGSNVPVPNIYAAEIGLPPETDVSNIAVPRATPAQTAPARPQASLKGEEAAYNTALRAARSGHINEAITLFRKFEQDYPNGRYKANADYWIGECLYSQGKLQDALAQFQNVNTVYPTHHKNADALLKAGMTLSRLGDQAGAQEKYRTLINTFPNTEAARRARAMGIK